MAIGPGTAYDLYLRNDPSGTNPEVGLVLDRDDEDKPRVREFRAPSVPPKQQSGPLSWTDKDALVDYVWAMDDWSDGALRPYYRDGDRRYAQANGIDARGEGVLAMAMQQEPQMSILLPDSGWENSTTGSHSPWVFNEPLGGDSIVIIISSTTAHTGGRSLVINTASDAGNSPTVTYSLPTYAAVALRGRAVTFGTYARAFNTSDTGEIEIDDGVGQTTTTVNPSVASAYFYFSVTRTIDSAATKIDIIFRTTNPGAGLVDGMRYDDHVFFVNASDTCVGAVEAGGLSYIAVGPLIFVLDTAGAQPFWKLSHAETGGNIATSIASFNDLVYIGYGTSARYILGRDVTGISNQTTIAYNDANPDTITDSGNGFVNAGFVAGDVISVTGSTSNDGGYTISTVVAGTITLVTGDALTTEAAGDTTSITAWRPAATSDPRDKAQFFVVQGNRLWKNASSNSVEYAETNSGSVDSSDFNVIFNGVSDTGSPLTGLYLLNNAIVLGTERGVAVFFEDEQRFRTIYTPFQTDPSSENFARGISHHDGWLYFTTVKQGLVRFNGYSFEDLSELFMAPRLTDYGGRVKAIASDPYQLWLLVDTPLADTGSGAEDKTVRLMSLRQIGGVWKLHVLHNAAIGDINFLVVAGNFLFGLGRLEHDDENNTTMSSLPWMLPIKVPFPFADEIGGRFLASTGTIDMPRWHGGQPDAEKALISVDFWVEDTDSNNTIQLRFGVDGAANTTTTFTVVNNTTTTTPAIVTKTTASDLSSGTPSTVAVGRVFDFRFSFVRHTSQIQPGTVTRTGGAEESPKLYAFAAHFVLRPSRKRAWEIFVRLGGTLLNGLRDDRGKSDVIANLDTLELQVFPIELEEDFDQNGVAVTRAVVIRDVERVLDEKLMGRSGRPLQEGEELWRLILQEV